MGRGPWVLFSPDGIVWEKGAPAWSGGVAAAIASGPEGHVLAGCPNSAFSADGWTWTLLDLPSRCTPGAATWTGTHYALVSATPAGTISQILTSPDGLAWDPVEIQTRPADIGLWSIHAAGSGDALVLAGHLGVTPTRLSLWYSDDRGATWLEAVINEADDAPTGEYEMWEMIHSDLGYFAVGGIETLTGESPGFILWSPNGAEWFQFITNNSQDFRSIGAVGDTAVASGFGTGLWSWKQP